MTKFPKDIEIGDYLLLGDTLHGPVTALPQTTSYDTVKVQARSGNCELKASEEVVILP